MNTYAASSTLVPGYLDTAQSGQLKHHQSQMPTAKRSDQMANGLAHQCERKCSQSALPSSNVLCSVCLWVRHGYTKNQRTGLPAHTHSFCTLCVCLSLSLSLSFFSFHSLPFAPLCLSCFLFLFHSRVINQSKDRTPYTHRHIHTHIYTHTHTHTSGTHIQARSLIALE